MTYTFEGEKEIKKSLESRLIQETLSNEACLINEDEKLRIPIDSKIDCEG